MPWRAADCTGNSTHRDASRMVNYSNVCFGISEKLVLLSAWCMSVAYQKCENTGTWRENRRGTRQEHTSCIDRRKYEPDDFSTSVRSRKPSTLSHTECVSFESQLTISHMSIFHNGLSNSWLFNQTLAYTCYSPMNLTSVGKAFSIRAWHTIRRLMLQVLIHINGVSAAM